MNGTAGVLDPPNQFANQYSEDKEPSICCIHQCNHEITQFCSFTIGSTITYYLCRYETAASDTDTYHAAESTGYRHKGKYNVMTSYLDAGAYSGSYGAFGWYADHPVGDGYQ